MLRTLSVLLVSFLLAGCSSQEAEKGRSPLDALDRAKLSVDEKQFAHPKEMVAWLQGHRRAVAALAFSKDGRVLASSSWDNTVRLWKFGESLPRMWAELEGSPSGVAISPDGKALICGGKDEAVHIWDLTGESPKQARKLAGHESRPFAVAFCPTGQHLATGCNAPVLRIWKWNQAEPETWGILTNEQVTSVGISSLSFSSDGKFLAAGNYAGDNSLRLWDIAEQGLTERQLPKQRARLVRCAPAGRMLAFHGETGIHIGQVQDQSVKPQRELPGHPKSTLRDLAFSPDGKTLASSGQDKKVVLWDITTGKKTREWQLPEEVKTLAFAPDLRHMAWGNEDGSVYIIRLLN